MSSGGDAAVEYAARLDQRAAFGLTSPKGTLRVADCVLSWQPDGWRTPVWHVPAVDVIGGAVGGPATHEVWLETSATGVVGVAIDPPGGWWATGGGNVPDLRGQVALDRFVAALRGCGARIHGEPRSLSSRPGGGVGIGWPC